MDGETHGANQLRQQIERQPMKTLGVKIGGAFAMFLLLLCVPMQAAEFFFYNGDGYTTTLSLNNSGDEARHVDFDPFWKLPEENISARSTVRIPNWPGIGAGVVSVA